MNAVEKALSDLRFHIPPAVLKTVFDDRIHGNYRQQMSVSVNDQIMHSVIRGRVLSDCSLVGTVEHEVPLASVQAMEISNNEVVYRIPKNLTQNRSIISAINITFIDPTASIGTGGWNQCGVSAPQTAAQNVMDSFSPVPIVSTSSLTIIGENTVLVRDVTRIPSNSYLRCILQKDEAMSHIQPRSFRAFAKLVEYAVKAYIYNEYIVEMDMAELRGGRALGKFRDIIEEYSDANQMYDDYLTEKWEKIERMNDPITHHRFIRQLVGGPR